MRNYEHSGLPYGLKPVGYDANTRVTTFECASGKFYESGTGNSYGVLHEAVPVHDQDRHAHMFSRAAATRRTEREVVPDMFQRGDSPTREPLDSSQWPLRVESFPRPLNAKSRGDVSWRDFADTLEPMENEASQKARPVPKRANTLREMGRSLMRTLSGRKISPRTPEATRFSLKPRKTPRRFKDVTPYEGT